jgi:hypothetical protein
MSKFNAVPISEGEAAESVPSEDSSPSVRARTTATSDNSRLSELEIENSRLHRLVAELLIKNQQLRTEIEA